MAAPSVADLFCKAVSEGSLRELKVLYQNHGREAIMANVIDTCSNIQGDTCLKAAVESEFFDVLEFLVHQLKEHIKLWMYKTWRNHVENVSPNSWETFNLIEVSEPFVLSPDIAAIRDICHQMPVTRLIEYIIDVTNDEPLWLEFVLKSIMASSIPRSDKIVALECMGIAFIFKQNDYFINRENQLNELIFWRGLRCWKEALVLRNATVEGDPTIPKVPCEQSEMLRNAFGDIAEITTVEELEELEQQWSLSKGLEEWQVLRESLEAQALLVGHRIFTQQTTTCLNSFHLENLVLFSNNCRKQCSAFNVCLVILDQSYGFTSTSPHKCIAHFVNTLNRLFNLFDNLHEDLPNDPERRKISATDNLVLTVKYALAVLTNVASVPPYHFRLLDGHCWQLNIQGKIFVLLSKWLSRLTREQIEKLKECLVPFFRIYNSNHGSPGLLHLAVNGRLDRSSTYMTTYSTTVVLIQLMLEAGADPQTTDRDGKTPFHCLFDGSVWIFNRTTFITLFKAMLDAGGHLDQATVSGHTVVSLMKGWRTSTSSFANIVRDPFFDSFIYSVLPLSCSCAQVIRRNQIPFENQLPPRLKLFVLRHSEFKITGMKSIQPVHLGNLFRDYITNWK